MGSEGWPPGSFLEVVAASAAATEDSKPRPLAGFDWATENMQMMMLVSYQQQLQLQHQASSCSDWGMRVPILGGGGVTSRTCDYIGQPQSSTTALPQLQSQSQSRYSLLRFGSDLAASQVLPPSLSSPRSSSSSCQVSGCQNELSGAKHYHRRHRVCQYHSKAATVQLTSGSPPHRFCQQCSRFHPVAEFDNEKRSCRKRLADHNKRRRKTHIDPNIKLEPTLIVPATANHGDEPALGIETKHGCKALMTLVSNLEADTLSTQNHNQNQSHATLEKGEELYSKTDARSLSWLRPELEKPARSKATTGTSTENLQKPGMAGSHWILRASVNNSNNKHGLDHNYVGLRLHDIKPSEQVQPQHVNLLYNHCHHNTFP